MNSYTSLSILLLFFISKSVFGQDSLRIYIQPNIHIGEILRLETRDSQIVRHEETNSSFNINSVEYKMFPNMILHNQYYPYVLNAPLERKIIFYRKSIGLPLTTSYEFSATDSIPRLILYDWEIGREERDAKKQKQITLNSKVVKGDYVDQYNSIFYWLTQNFGEPVENSKEEVTRKDTTVFQGREYIQEYKEQYSKWDNDNFQIGLSLMYANNTKRVRLNYYKKVK